MQRHDFTDREINAVRHLRPSQKSDRPGRLEIGNRTVTNGIMWILTAGARWRDIPGEFGKSQTIYAHFRRWTSEELLIRVYRSLLHRFDALEKIDQSPWCVDGSVIRVRRSASGTILQSDENDELNALGRSRGGYSQRSILCDARGALLAITATGGQRHESQQLENVKSNCELSPHRYYRRPETIAGDNGYRTVDTRKRIQSRLTEPIIASLFNEIRDCEFDLDEYRRRNTVEGLVSLLKELRRVAMR